MLKPWKRYELKVAIHHAARTGHVTLPWERAPESVLRASGWITDTRATRLRRRLWAEEELNGIPEFGLDAIAIETRDDGTVVHHGIQAKAWDPETTRALRAEDLGSFLLAQQVLKDHNPASRGHLYSTGPVTRLTSDFMGRAGYYMERLPMPAPEDGAGPSSGDTAAASAPELRPYQREAVEALCAGWEGTGLLSMPCGTGKTLCVAAWLAECADAFDVVVVASPLLAQVDQTMRRLQDALPDAYHVLVDGEGSRDVGELVRIVEGEAGQRVVVLHATYVSTQDVVAQVLNRIGDDASVVLVVDEAHNVPGRPVLRKLVEDVPISLLVTATPTSVMMDEMDCEVVFDMPMSRAIAEKWVVDYGVYLPALRRLPEGEGGTEVDVDLEEIGAEHDKTLAAKALFLATGMLDTGSRRCIVYLSSVKECEAFMDTMQDVVRRYHSLPFWGALITEDVGPAQRRQRLSDFQGGDDRSLRVLASVHVLKEGVDLPRCDSVFVTSVSDRADEARIVQMAMRANRLDVLHPNKKAAIFLWTRDWAAAIGVLSTLRETDEAFVSKVRMLHADYDKSTDAATQQAVEVQIGELQRYVEVRCVTVEQLFNQRCEELVEYCEEHGRLPAEKDDALMAGGAMRGRWVSHMKQALLGRGTHRLTGARRESLLAIPIMKAWYDTAEPRTDWAQHAAQLKEHVEASGSLPTRKTNERLYGWLNNQKLKVGTLSEDQKATLMAIDGVKELMERPKRAPPPPWSESFERVKAFEAQNSRLPTQPDALGIWCNGQVKSFAKHKLADDRIAKLLAIPTFKRRLEGHASFANHPYVLERSSQASA